MSSEGLESLWADDQVLLTEFTVGSVDPTVTLRIRSSCCGVSVPAADARKAEGASEVTRRTPSPPSLTGRLAWSDWRSVRSKLVVAQTPFRNILSMCFRKGCVAHGAHLSVCISLGALNEVLKRTKAS